MRTTRFVNNDRHLEGNKHKYWDVTKRGGLNYKSKIGHNW